MNAPKVPEVLYALPQISISSCALWMWSYQMTLTKVSDFYQRKSYEKNTDAETTKETKYHLLLVIKEMRTIPHYDHEVLIVLDNLLPIVVTT